MDEALGISSNIGISIIFFLIAGTFLFLLIGILSLYFCVNRNLLKRNHKVWNMLTKFYYLYILIVFATFGALIGGLFGLNRSIIKNIDKKVPTLIESSALYIPQFKTYLKENLDSMQVAGFSTEEIADQFIDNKIVAPDFGFIGSFKNKLSKWIFKGFFEGIMIYSAYKVGVKQSTLQSTVQILSEFDLKKTDNGLTVIVIKTIKKQVNSLFKGMYLSQLINFLLFIFLPILDIIVYFNFAKNRIVLK